MSYTGKSMTIEKLPVTRGIRVLRAAKVVYTEHPYKYEEHGGTAVSVRELGVHEHTVVKTLVMEDEHKQPMIVLMHGDCHVSTKELARQIGVKKVFPCAAEIAEKHTGYRVGGTSPFGMRKSIPVYVEASILDLPLIYINAGHRGYLVRLNPRNLLTLLHPTVVKVSMPG